jgi:ATP adenylyltransferase
MLLSKYQALIHTIGLNNSNSTSYSYNLIITRHWIKIALRSAPAYASISLNALGFAGIFNVRNESQVKQVKELLPSKILQGIGVPPK